MARYLPLARLKSTFAAGAHPHAYGLVDRDTWSDEDVVAEKSAEPRQISERVRLGVELDVVVVAAEFDRRCREILAAPETQQWQTGVHGKAALVQLLATAQGAPPRELRLNLAEQIARPPPADQLIAMLLPSGRAARGFLSPENPTSRGADACIARCRRLHFSASPSTAPRGPWAGRAAPAPCPR